LEEALMIYLQSCSRANPVSLTSIALCLSLLLSGTLFAQPLSPAIPAPQQTNRPLSTTQNPPIQRLEVNRPIEGEMRGGETHFYEINFIVGQYVRLVVEQKGIDVVVTLWDPNHTQIVEVDRPNGAFGREPISLVTESSGVFRLAVRSLDKNAQAGRYEAKLEEVRAANQQDSESVAGDRVFLQGEAFEASQTPEEHQKATERYLLALTHWRIAGERKKEGMALNQLGLMYSSSGEIEKAHDYYNQALAIRRAIDDKNGQGRTLNNIGLLYKLDTPRLARQYFIESLPLIRATDDQQAESIVLNNIGESSYYLSEYQPALDAFGQALKIFREQRNGRDEALALSNIGVIYLDFEEYPKALDYFQQSLELRQKANHKIGQGNALNNLGFVYFKMGEHEKALTAYDQAIKIRQAVGDTIGLANTLRNTGLLYSTVGKYEQALDYYNQSLKIYQARNNLTGASTALTRMGYLYLDLKQYGKALEAFNQSLPLHRTTQTKSAEASTLYGLARVASEQGNFAEARSRSEAALTILESIRARVSSQELRASYLAKIQNYYEFYADLLMQMGKGKASPENVTAAFEIVERGRARTLIESLLEARADIHQGVEPKLLEQKKSLQEQLNVKANLLLRLLAGRRTEKEENDSGRGLEKIIGELQEVETQIRRTSPKYAALIQPQHLSVSEIQKQVLDTNSLLLEYTLGEKRSYLFAITSHSINAYELPKRPEIEAAARRVYDLLTARNQLIEYETIGEKKPRVEKADADFHQAAAALSQMILAPVAAELKNRRLLIVSDGAMQYIPFAALPSPDPTRAKTEWLALTNEIVNLPSASTLAVLRREIQNRKPAPKAIAVLADPVFDKNDQRVTFAKARQKKDSPVVAHARNRSNSRGNSASQAHQQAATIQTKSALQPLAVSDNTRKTESDLTRAAREAGLKSDGFSLPRIAFTRLEAKAIARLVPPAQQKVAIDFEANKSTALSKELSQYRFVHFATHGFLNTTHPELSGIALSLIDEVGNEQDGFLRAHEIYNLKLSAELVVLSGCRTGLGKEIRGEGLIGMTRGFMYAGAARVLVSLWDVSDEATAEFMSRFYQAMLGKEPLSPAAALRVAQASMAKDKRWGAPYYWAAFVLQGEPR
jgi:CHAT domain-containing protein/tetratricopeptide (TPR) repeat protein